MALSSERAAKKPPPCVGCGSLHVSAEAVYACCAHEIERLRRLIDEMRRPAQEYYSMKRAMPVKAKP